MWSQKANFLENITWSEFKKRSSKLYFEALCAVSIVISTSELLPPGGGGGEVLELIFAGYVPLASQSAYSITVYSVAKCKPHVSHFWANM